MTADEIIAQLGLQRHPEGGWYAETFRDTRQVEGGRAASTAIYYLLKAGEASAWHRVDAAEIWHFHAGAPLELKVASPAGEAEVRLLGSDLGGGERPQAVVSAGWWQAARSLGEWTLVGCTVAPGFVFEAFELAPVGWSPGGEPA